MADLVAILNSIISREHMGWCDALINKDEQGMQETAAWVRCCLEIAERLGLQVERPLGWNNMEEIS